jgi:hypothetical protein
MNPHRVKSRPSTQRGAGIGRPRLSALGRQLWLAGSSVEGAVCAAGRSLRDESGFRAHGSNQRFHRLLALTTPSSLAGVSPAATRILTPHGWRRKGPPGTLLHKGARKSLLQWRWEKRREQPLNSHHKDLGTPPNETWTVYADVIDAAGNPVNGAQLQVEDSNGYGGGQTGPVTNAGGETGPLFSPLSRMVWGRSR